LRNVTDYTVIPLITKCSNLTQLQFCTTESSQLVDIFKCCTKLRHLPLEPFSQEVVNALWSSKLQLETLYLWNNEESLQIKFPAQLPSLRELSMGQRFQEIYFDEPLINLTKLEIAYSDKHRNFFEIFKYTTNLKELRLLVYGSTIPHLELQRIANQHLKQ